MSDRDTPMVRALRGPVTLITVGVLFALNNFTEYSFHKTWPVLLIVFGLLSLLGRSSAAASPAPPPPYNPPPAGGPYDPVTGAYRGPQAGYNPPPPPQAAAGRGGFGTSAPPRSFTDPGSETPPPAAGG